MQAWSKCVLVDKISDTRKLFSDSIGQSVNKKKNCELIKLGKQICKIQKQK